jgi:hypothetical protein
MEAGQYGRWIDRPCDCAIDVLYYKQEARQLAQLARDYLAFIGETEEGRGAIRAMQLPDFAPLSYSCTHRQMLERLYSMADFLCRLDAIAGCPDDGYMIEKRRNGELFFMPPTIETMPLAVKQMLQIWPRNARIERESTHVVTARAGT